LVASALQANARPAPTIVSAGGERRTRLSRYGKRLAHPSPSSTSVIVSCCEVWLAERGGAVSATPTTPIAIASTHAHS
jgi:hypothetical protein